MKLNRTQCVCCVCVCYVCKCLWVRLWLLDLTSHNVNECCHHISSVVHCQFTVQGMSILGEISYLESGEGLVTWRASTYRKSVAVNSTQPKQAWKRGHGNSDNPDDVFYSCYCILILPKNYVNGVYVCGILNYFENNSRPDNSVDYTN